VGKCRELAGPTKQGRESHRHPHKSHETMLFLAPSRHASIARQMLQKWLQDIFGRMRHVLSRMLLSTGGSVSSCIIKVFSCYSQVPSWTRKHRKSKNLVLRMLRKGETQCNHFSSVNNLIHSITAILHLQYIISATLHTLPLCIPLDFHTKTIICPQKWLL